MNNQYFIIALIVFLFPLFAIILDRIVKLFSKANSNRSEKEQSPKRSFQKPKELTVRSDRFYGTTRASKQLLKRIKQHFHPDNLVIELNPSLANELYDHLYSNLLQAKGSYEDLYECGWNLLAENEIKGKCSIDEWEGIRSYYNEKLSRR